MPGKGISENCDRCYTKTGGSCSNCRMAAQQAYYMLTGLDLPCARVFFATESPPRRVDWQMQTCADGSGGPVGLAVL